MHEPDNRREDEEQPEHRHGRKLLTRDDAVTKGREGQKEETRNVEPSNRLGRSEVCDELGDHAIGAASWANVSDQATASGKRR